MKKLLLVFFLLNVWGLRGNLTYDPVHNVFYTTPANKGINQREYKSLMQRCWQISERIKLAKSGLSFSNREIFDQCIKYLNQVGSPTAKRLIEDLKKDTIFYPDGSVLGNIFV